jgi:hypothetical protein
VDLQIFWEGYKDPTWENFEGFARDAAPQVEKYFMKNLLKPFQELKGKSASLYEQVKRQKTELKSLQQERNKLSRALQRHKERQEQKKLRENNDDSECCLSQTGNHFGSQKKLDTAQQLDLAKYFMAQLHEKEVWKSCLIKLPRLGSQDKEQHDVTIENPASNVRKTLSFSP